MLHSVSPGLTTYHPGSSTLVPAVSQLRATVFSRSALRLALASAAIRARSLRLSAAIRARSLRLSARGVGALPLSAVFGSPAFWASGAFLGSAGFFGSAG